MNSYRVVRQVSNANMVHKMYKGVPCNTLTRVIKLPKKFIKYLKLTTVFNNCDCACITRSHSIKCIFHHDNLNNIDKIPIGNNF